MLKTTEHKEQCTVKQFCDAKKIMMFAIPNGTNIPSYKGRAKAQAEGLKKGVPDLFIPEPFGKYHGLFIEMKKPVRSQSKLSIEQKNWIEMLNLKGYSAHVCYGANDAINTIEEYFR